MIEQEQLLRECAQMGIEIGTETAKRLDVYAQILVEWNEKINLTAIIKPEEIVTKHFVDSLALLGCDGIPLGPSARVIDVGTGAGFPSVPLKVARPDLQLTLLDSLQKRVRFLGVLSEAMGQENICVHARAEEAGQMSDYREQFDLATARAVAHLRELCEFCLPFVRVGGYFVALKGGEVEAEAGEAAKAIRVLGGQLEAVRRYQLPDGSGRSLVVIKKISHCSTQYPRPHAKMTKKPLV